MKKFLILNFLIIFSFLCSAVEESLLVPAIMEGGKGNLLRIEIEIREGKGDIYIRVEPPIGVYTQTSEKIAVEVAMRMAKKDPKKYDVFLRIEKGEAGVVDGPSGGAAIALLTFALLENKTIRKDFTLTGTIEEDGSVGAVGGILEKVMAAGEKGFKLFLIPKQGIYEKISLIPLKRELNVTVIEIDHIEDAVRIAFAQEGMLPPIKKEIIVEGIPTSLEKIELPNTTYMKKFKEVAADMINEMDENLQKIKNIDPDVRTYLENEINKSKALFERGYLYSAANNVFIMGVYVKLLEYENISAIEVREKIDKVKECVKNAVNGGMDEKNFEWYIGANLRLNWAKDKIEKVEEMPITNKDEMIMALIEGLYAESWCNAYERMRVNGYGNKEKELKELAKEYIEFTENYLKGIDADEDALWHFEVGKKEFNEGKYGSAIFDALYAYTTASATEDGKVKEEEEIMNEIINIKEKKMESFWADIYLAHAKYNIAHGNTINALKLLRYADALESAVKRIKEVLEEKGEMGVGVGEGIEKDEVEDKIKDKTDVKGMVVIILFLSLISAIFLIFVQLSTKRST